MVSLPPRARTLDWILLIPTSFGDAARVSDPQAGFGSLLTTP